MIFFLNITTVGEELKKWEGKMAHDYFFWNEIKDTENYNSE